jgi:hypothetical protein
MRSPLLSVAAAACALLVACSGGPSQSTGPAVTSPTTPGQTIPAVPVPTPRLDSTWDVATRGVPPLIQSSYIDLARIQQVSRFRSGIGHDYSDDAERCRSMKHYYMPAGQVWNTVRIFAPVTGHITRVDQEWAGVQLHLQSSAYPAFTVVLFHVGPSRPLGVGDSVLAGQQLGTHIGTVTTSDVAVWAMLPGGKRGLVSYIDALPDALFAPYVARGIATRDALVIPRAERDAAPLVCDGETFTGKDSLPQWTVLR